MSEAAVSLCRDQLFIDLHIDTLIPPRLWGYDIFRDHTDRSPGLFFGHLDVPRIEAVGMNAAMWSITTNPFRTARSRFRVYTKNLEKFSRQVRANSERLRWVRTAQELRQGKGIGVLLSIQGGNALQSAPASFWDTFDDRLTRVTLVHLTNSAYGTTNSPWHRLSRHHGLTHAGADFVRRLNTARVFVDLAHIHPRAFWEALEIHDPSIPPIVTHTGVTGVSQHWRNIDNAQIKAIADRGGVVGIMAHSGFLKRKGGPKGVEMIAEHIEHVVNVGGEDTCAIGTDFDGAIVPPRGFRSGLMYPRLVQALLDRGYAEQLITKILGQNFERSFRDLRG